MRREDFDEFAQLLDAAYDLIGKTPQAKVISATSKALFFQALAEYPLPAVRAAIAAHVKDPVAGRFTPAPADIIQQLQAAGTRDTRPGPEEAWSIALASQDERDTVVWTSETAEAFRIARPVLESSGPISGRKTFIEAYTRLVEAARVAKTPAKWSAHLGWDQAGQALALQRAQEQGLLPAPSVAALLPPPEVDEFQLSGGARDQLARIKKLLADSAAERERRLQAQVDHRNQTEAEFRRTTAERVRQYQQFARMADEAQVQRAEVDRTQQAADSC